jgi:hypothetical protein
MRDLPDAAYGEQATFRDDQAGAPMAMGGPGGGAPGGGAPTDADAPIVPLDAPTQRPDEPGQSGASLGPGLGPESLGLVDPSQQLEQADVDRIRNVLPMLEYMSNLPGAMPSTRQLVRRLKGAI